MLLSSILVFVVEMILCFVVSFVTGFTQNNGAAIFGIIASIALIAFSIVGIINSIKAIKAANQRGKSIAALVFFITDVTTGVTLFILSLMFTFVVVYAAI